MKSGTNKPRDLDLEVRIRAEVERIREEHAYCGDYRKQLRALIETLFFKFGERAGATRLVSLLAEDGRSPSTSTAQDEINQFWKRLQETAKVRIERPDLPEFLLEVFGQAAATVWDNALAQADAALAAFRAEAEDSVSAAESRAAEADRRASAAEVAARQTAERASAADAQREELAVQLAAEQAARHAAEQSLSQVRAESEGRERKRAEEAADLRRTIEELRAASDRVEREQRRLLVVADDYKTAAARDREARKEADENNRALNIAMQSMQGNINRLSNERGILEGRAEAAEKLADRLQEDRDAALAKLAEATARAGAAEARVRELEAALLTRRDGGRDTNTAPVA
ncbi:DNA-binding protein [Burkholderia ubonensis]|uniref:DNA-binding protein n=1 Tax=Burkholderia ubonensis TaxID=101571 RepID=UPI000B16B185|nr:DNA-binding protein [Burkholderia ubonensis]